ncbi:hypothetical protein MKK69_08140 [Methylobacterium sp. J-026]|uniref:hypothetical protein n=1 Tax=Methylobacterium sp. J-026 TaxID=2836624 RepID=UPI001FB8A60F|nr:hypothetical protein [Methylobacterium sp. J-026]MCJ2134035.1 hypothetical protein [Methylobacterium sp. J-026]
MQDDRQDRGLSRADFEDAEAYALYLHQSGLEPDGAGEAVIGPAWSYVAGTGPAASLHRAIHGHTERQHAQAWAGWGETKGVRAAQFLAVYQAVAFANYRGWVLNTFVSVTWSTVGVTSDVAAAAATKRFLDLCRRHLRGLGLTPAFVWVVERGDTFGLHLHLLLHVPEMYGHAFRNWIPKGFATATRMKPVAIPGRDGERGVKTLDLRRPRVGETERQQVAEQWRVFRYLLKGLSPDLLVSAPDDRRAKLPAAQELGLSTRDQGIVTSKRVGVARELGTAAQTQHAAATGAKPCFVTDQGWREPDELYGDQYLQQGRSRTLLSALEI